MLRAQGALKRFQSKEKYMEVRFCAMGFGISAVERVENQLLVDEQLLPQGTVSQYQVKLLEQDRIK